MTYHQIVVLMLPGYSPDGPTVAKIDDMQALPAQAMVSKPEEEREVIRAYLELGLGLGSFSRPTMIEYQDEQGRRLGFRAWQKLNTPLVAWGTIEDSQLAPGLDVESALRRCAPLLPAGLDVAIAEMPQPAAPGAVAQVLTGPKREYML